MSQSKRSGPASVGLSSRSSVKLAPQAKQQPAREPVQFRYLLAQFVAERRNDGWWVARSWTTSIGEKPRWEGPFPFPQEAVIAVARHLCAELSNRHQAKARFHQVKPNDPLFGLPQLPDLSSSAKRGGRS